MARTFRQAFPEYATATVTEMDGKDISAATLQVGLSVSNEVPPTAWVNPSTSSRPTPQTARVSLLIDYTIGVSPGDYYLWVKVADAPEVIPRPAANHRLHIV